MHFEQTHLQYYVLCCCFGISWLGGHTRSFSVVIVCWLTAKRSVVVTCARLVSAFCSNWFRFDAINAALCYFVSSLLFSLWECSRCVGRVKVCVICNADIFVLLLWSPYVIGQTIIFLPCDFYLSIFFYLLFFFPRLISAVGDWMSTILLHMAWF